MYLPLTHYSGDLSYRVNHTTDGVNFNRRVLVWWNTLWHKGWRESWI